MATSKFKLKKISTDLINIIETLKSDLPIHEFNLPTIHDNKLFSLFFNSVIEKYKSINIDKATINHSKTQLYPDNSNSGGNKCALIDLFRFLYKSNNIDEFLISYTPAQITQFKQIIKQNNFEKCSKWINLYGKSFMNNIFILIQNESIQKKKLPPSLLQKLNVIDKDVYSEFTSLDVLKEIEQLMNYKHHFSISYNNITVELSIFDYKKTLNKKKLDLIIKRILLMGLIKQESNLVNKKSNKVKINVNLILTNKTKNISTQYKTLGPTEINSGLSTYAYNYDEFCKVTIYREEELNKLLIHELIHNLRLDFLFVNFTDFYNFVNIPPDTKITLNESYTEIMACILNSIVCSYELNNRKNKKLAIRYINYEILFSFYQVAKILCHFGFINSHEFFKPTTTTSFDNAKFIQNTNVFSYFIVKTSLLLNMDLFLKFLSHIQFMNMPLYNKTSRDTYLAFVKKSLLNPIYIHIIDEFMNYIKSVKQKKKILDTLRMTIIEI